MDRDGVGSDKPITAEDVSKVRIEIPQMEELPPIDFNTREAPLAAPRRKPKLRPVVPMTGHGAPPRRIFPFNINKLPIDGGSARWNGTIASC